MNESNLGNRVSVIVPFYNSEQFIMRSVNSVLAQSFDNLEVILIDDGSEDGTFDLCKGLEQSDNRVKVFSQCNSGASAARNKGLEVSAGDWIMFVDSDDWIDHTMLEEMMRVVEDFPFVDVVQSRVPRDMKDQKGEGLYSSEESVRCLLEGSWWGPVSKLIRRSSIGSLRFPPKTICEDYYFNYHLFSKISSLYFLDKCFYHREDTQGSLSKISLSERKFDEFYNVKAVYDAVEREYPQYRELAEAHLAGSCLKLLFLIFSKDAASEYSDQTDEIMKTIWTHYKSFINNHHIPSNVRILLSTCFSKPSAKLAHRLYKMFK